MYIIQYFYSCYCSFCLRQAEGVFTLEERRPGRPLACSPKIFGETSICPLPCRRRDGMELGPIYLECNNGKCTMLHSITIQYFYSCYCSFCLPRAERERQELRSGGPVARSRARQRFLAKLPSAICRADVAMEWNNGTLPHLFGMQQWEMFNASFNYNLMRM
jgi:hypothetical protein